MNCQYCQKEISGFGKKYCSLLCANRALGKTRQAIGRKVYVSRCLHCDTEFSSKDKRKKFCKHSCSASYHNQKRKGQHISKLWHTCKGCNKEIYRADYCYDNCKLLHQIQSWLIGELDGCWKYTHASYVRAYLNTRSNNKCEMPDCGECRTRTDGSSILQVDHIDGNWRNNTPNNVRLICPTCHALTDNYGARNMGNGRTWKRTYNQFTALKV